MALTNLASCSSDLRKHMSAKQVPRALIYLMFSEHEQVQRAATEAMCNLLPDSACSRRVLEQTNPGVKLWVALSEVWDDEETLKTAEAACGGLCSIANMYGQIDEGEPVLGEESGPAKLLEAGVATAIVDILKNSRLPSMEHRAAVCMQYLCENEDGQIGVQLREAFIKAGAIRAVQKLLNPPAPKKDKKTDKKKAKKQEEEVEQIDISSSDSVAVVVEDVDEDEDRPRVDDDEAGEQEEEEEEEAPKKRPRIPISGAVKEALVIVMHLLREQKQQSSKTKGQGGQADGLDYSRFEFMEDDDSSDNTDDEDDEEAKTEEDIEREEQMTVLMEKLQEKLTETEQQVIVDEPSQDKKLELVQKALSEHPEVQEAVKRELITRRVARAKAKQEAAEKAKD